MASIQTIAGAVQAAARSARIDASAPSQPVDERVRFDVDALARVLRLSTLTADDYNKVVAACDTEMHRQINPEGNIARALAALRLQDRVTAPRLAYRQGPDGLIEALHDS